MLEQQRLAEGHSRFIRLRFHCRQGIRSLLSRQSKNSTSLGLSIAFVVQRLHNRKLLGSAKSSRKIVLCSPLHTFRSALAGRPVEAAEPHQWNQALAGTTGVVNLVGTPIATRWNPDVKADIKASRIKTTQRVSV
jgi:hypothetical protein